ncbi:hypothetical protein VZQ01_41825 [Myxococcus faecalis]|uniref:hypothetical protein n=1 Tax=Myxococcus faecalis TaxID=3115646 RepID=UPI003CE987D7
MTLDELEQCISQLLALARSRGIERLDTGKRDYYWNVPSPEWVDMTKQPPLTVGSLDDDLVELDKLRAQPERAASVDLDRAAAMLRLISDELSR